MAAGIRINDLGRASDVQTAYTVSTGPAQDGNESPYSKIIKNFETINEVQP